MNKVDAQSEFLQNVAKLILAAVSLNIKLTGGELYRTQEQQNIYLNTGKTQVKHSRHMDRLAIDFNFFVQVEDEWKLSWNKKDVQRLGDFWEGLNPLNRWGGNWKTFQDIPHFERIEPLN